MKNLIILLNLLLISVSTSYSQNDTIVKNSLQNDELYLKRVDSAFISSVNTPDTLVIDSIKTNALVRAGDAFIYTLVSPVRWKKKDWLTAGATLGGAALVSTIDEPVNDFFNRDQGHWANNFESFGFHNGKPYAAMITTGGFYLTGLVIKNEWAKETAVILGTAYLTSGAIQTAMKKIVGRGRPGAGYGPYEFRPFHKEASFSSFPSGHVQIALVTSMVLAERVEPIWLKSIFYAGAAVTLTSRMYVGAHWLSDVTFGSAISYFCTKTVMKRLERNKYDNPLKRKEDRHKISWQVTPNFNGIGVVGIF